MGLTRSTTRDALSFRRIGERADPTAANRLQREVRKALLDADDEHMDLVKETVENLREEEPEDDELIRETNPDEVRIVISLKPRKAPDPEQIPNKALKTSPKKSLSL